MILGNKKKINKKMILGNKKKINKKMISKKTKFRIMIIQESKYSTKRINFKINKDINIIKKILTPNRLTITIKNVIVKKTTNKIITKIKKDLHTITMNINKVIIDSETIKRTLIKSTIIITNKSFTKITVKKNSTLIKDLSTLN